VLTNPAHLERFRRYETLYGFKASTLGVIASTAAFEDGESWLDETLSYLDDNRWVLVQELSAKAASVGCTVPAATYLAWLDFSGFDLPETVGTFIAKRAGVFAVDGTTFGPGGEQRLRFNFAMPRHVLRTAVQRMATAVAPFA